MKRFALFFSIGIVGCLIAMGLIRWSKVLVPKIQMELSDLFMVRVDGLRLGSIPSRKDIVLIDFDERTALQLKSIQSFPSDLQVYKNLIDAGAKLVYDCRLVASANDQTFNEILPLLNGMHAVDSEGRVTRDIWIRSSLLAEHGDRFKNLSSQNIINAHGHASRSLESRIYTIAHVMNGIPQESAPLTIARRVENLSQRSATETIDELFRSGVATEWKTTLPDYFSESESKLTTYTVGKSQFTGYQYAAIGQLVAPVGFWVSYSPTIADFKRHSYLDVMNGASRTDFEGKIVLIGYAAKMDPTSDTYTIPNLSGKASASEVVACATQTLLDGKNMRPLSWIMTVAMGLPLMLIVSLVAGYAKPIQASLICLVAIALYYATVVGLYRSDWYADFAVVPALGIVTAVNAGAANAWLSLRARQRVVDLFGRYVPRAIVNQLVQRSDLQSLTLGGVNRNVTVLFADIRGFTSFSRDLEPEAVVKNLNSLLEIMVNCTFENEGTLDKFIGDAILVLFNAPLDQSDHVERAIRTAIQIQAKLEGHFSGLKVGIGVHCGEAIVGNIGTLKRMEYTAIGNTVNIASRLCDTAKPGEVIVSQTVLEAIRTRKTDHEFNIESIAKVQVKGFETPLEIARVVR